MIRIKDLLRLNSYDFVRPRTRLYYLDPWNAEISNDIPPQKTSDYRSELPFGAVRLEESDLPNILEAYEESPKVNSEYQDLWALFHCYVYLVWNELDKWEKQQFYDAWCELYKIDGSSTMASLSNKESLALAEAETKEIVWSIISYSRELVKAKSFFKQSGFHLEECILCESKHDAMIYELLLCIAYPDAARNGAEILSCKQCGELFIKEKNRQIYCPKHNTDAAKTARYKQKKKEGK